MSQKQFLIYLYFAINKSQNQSLDIVGVDLQSFTFIHSQLYIVFSWVTNISKLCVLLLEKGNRKTTNIIYFEVFLQAPTN